MTTNECKTIQQELDEAEANEPMSAKAADHLRSCDECRRFDSDQRTLHGLIASLEPVAAPPDFDFRLRARIAREKSRDRSSVGLSSFLRIPRAVAVVSLILLAAVAGVIVKNWMTSPTRTVAVAPSQPQNEPSKTTRTPQI